MATTSYARARASQSAAPNIRPASQGAPRLRSKYAGAQAAPAAALRAFLWQRPVHDPTQRPSKANASWKPRCISTDYDRHCSSRTCQQRDQQRPDGSMTYPLGPRFLKFLFRCGPSFKPVTQLRRQATSQTFELAKHDLMNIKSDHSWIKNQSQSEL